MHYSNTLPDGLKLAPNFQSGVFVVRQNEGIRFFRCIDRVQNSCYRFFPCSSDVSTEDSDCYEYAVDEDACSADAITEDEVQAAQIAWGEGIVHISDVFLNDGDFRQAAIDHIERFYAYNETDVLFKPTLASEEQFRGTFEEALSYFVGGSIPEDGGFAIAPWTNVRWEPEGKTILGGSAVAMGNYYFTRPNDEEVKVEYSFGYIRGADGELKIVLHHSSVPFQPSET